MNRSITVLMDLPEENDSYRYTVDALEHAIAAVGAPVSFTIVPSDAMGGLGTNSGEGIVIGPGSPYRDPAAAEGAIRTAREKGIPLVGT
ncbi:MAG TPA: hypothetical protein VK461_17085 [Acidimicrobiales bacterium]|nr:hypothetical protein [Acidimicrobiales bacterium]